jgi:hypothetical protein
VSLPVNAALRILALQHAPLVALIADRMIDPVLDQAGPYPAIAYRRIGGGEEPTLTSGTDGHAEAVYRFFSTSKGQHTKAVAVAVDAALRDAILGFAGTITNSASPPQSGDIQTIFFQSTRDFYDDLTQTHQVATDYEVSFTTDRP